MKNTVSLLLVFLISAAFSSVIAQDQPARISATWQVQKYDITANLPTAETDRNLSGRAVLQLKNVTERPATSLTLRINQNAAVSTVEINGTTTDFTKRQEKLGTSNLQLVAIRVPAVAAGGSLTASVTYKLPVQDNSGLAALTAGGAQFLPLSFWYPTPNSWYFARGADFAPVKIQVNAGTMSVVSAGASTGTVFESGLYGQPFFAAGNWERSDSSGIPFFLPKGSASDSKARAAEIAGLLTEARTFVEQLLGKAPDAPFRVVAVRRGAGFGFGGTMLVDEAVFRRPKLDSVTALALAEAVVRMWIGDSALVTDDGAGVVREGLARYIATQFIESKYGRDVAEVERLRHRAAYSAISRRDAPLATVAPLDDYYFAAVANKGAMFWRLVERKIGRDQFYSILRTQLQSGRVTLSELRGAYSAQREFIDFMLDQVTDMNLQAGLPQAGAGETKAALRNTGAVDVTVNVVATLATGERLSSPTTIRAGSFGEVVFKTSQKVMAVEIDPEKLYPQVDYSDDKAPRETTDSDLLLAVKRDFDRQQFDGAMKTARDVLKAYPRYDDVRVLLGRSLLAQNKFAEAESEFKAVADEKLPSARSLGWAYMGLADVASKSNRAADAMRLSADVLRLDAEYGASLLARTIRNRHNASSGTDESIKAFFSRFDAAAISNRKAELEALAIPGEVNRFVSGISGQATDWKTTVVHVDQLDADTVLVETTLAVRLLTREPESGPAVFRLTRTPSGWKLSGIDIFEVR